MNEIEETRRGFKQLTIDIAPAINIIEKALKEHGVNGIASLAVSADGYFKFSHSDTSWELVRAFNDCKPKMKVEYEEELEWED